MLPRQQRKKQVASNDSNSKSAIQAMWPRDRINRFHHGEDSNREKVEDERGRMDSCAEEKLRE